MRLQGKVVIITEAASDMRLVIATRLAPGAPRLSQVTAMHGGSTMRSTPFRRVVAPLLGRRATLRARPWWKPHQWCAHHLRSPRRACNIACVLDYVSGARWEMPSGGAS